MNKISDHISYNEAIRSKAAKQHGIDNTPSKTVLQRMIYVAVNLFEPLRKHFGVKIFLASFFRCIRVNKKVGGSGTSFHVYGAAIDIDADIYGGVKNIELFWFVFYNLPFTELIFEYPKSGKSDCMWVHIALAKGRDNEKKVKIKEYGKKARIFDPLKELPNIYSELNLKK